MSQHLRSSLAIAGSLALCLPTAGAALTFTPLGDLETGQFSSAAYGISGDGSVVVGQGNIEAGPEAFRWTQATGMLPILDLPGGANDGRALATDLDGSRTVGQGTAAGGREAFFWDAPLGPTTPIGHLDPDGTLDSTARGVSADGSVIVGQSNSVSGFEAFIWDATGMRSLGDFADGPVQSAANDVSADGSVVIGVGSHFGGPSESEAAMWVNEGAIQGLGTLAGGDNRSLALGVSADGGTVVGAASSAASAASQLGALEAFRWTSVLTMDGLGDLDGGAFDSAANATSSDGSVIVGRGTTADGDRAFLWTEQAGMIDLNDLAASLLPEGWILEEAFDVSDDGLSIVGRGSNADGDNEAWLLTIDFAPVPEPGTGLLLALGLTLLARRRR